MEVNCGSDRLGERSAKGPHRGPVARDLESGEAQQAGIDASTELEEIRSSGPQGSLCGPRVWNITADLTTVTGPA